MLIKTKAKIKVHVFLRFTKIAEIKNKIAKKISQTKEISDLKGGVN